MLIQVSITLIATGFKRQEESDDPPQQVPITLHPFPVGFPRNLKGLRLHCNFGEMQVDVTGFNRRSTSFSEGSSVEIPEFLRKKGRSRYPRA